MREKFCPRDRSRPAIFLSQRERIEVREKFRLQDRSRPAIFLSQRERIEVREKFRSMQPTPRVGSVMSSRGPRSVILRLSKDLAATSKSMSAAVGYRRRS